MHEKLKDIIQDCNFNFLLGSGLSAPYLRTLGNIEILMTQLEASDLSLDKNRIIRASLYKKYFEDVIVKNLSILESAKETDEIVGEYKRFLRNVNSILIKRKSSILTKECNIFTTNIDIFIEKALEELGLTFNDGFSGRFRPIFNLSNFKITYRKKSSHYDNISDLPTYNLAKLHGSLSWKIDNKADNILFGDDLDQIRIIQVRLPEANKLVEIENDSTVDKLSKEAEGKGLDESVKAFMEEYEKLLIVNPTKDKFRITLLNQTYYELLRIYANELEKENTLLMAMGFSFSDEHIRTITLRAADSNPTLEIYIIAYNAGAKAELETRMGISNNKNANIKVIAPPQEDGEGEGKTKKDLYEYSLSKINSEIFENIFREKATVKIGKVDD